MDNHDVWLAATLVELAETADTDCGEAAYAELVAACVAELEAPAEVGVLLARASGDMTVAAASTSRARDVVSFDEAHREGPGTDCGASGEQALNEPLARAAARWPRFTQAARAAGFAMVSAFPMRRRAQTVGAIIVLHPGRLLATADAGRVQAIAKMAAITVAQQREFRQSVLAATQLQHALDSRVIIEQAKGAIAARLGITPNAAFALLRDYARSESQPLARVAEQTISGGLTPGTLIAARPGKPAQRLSARQSR